MSAVPAVTPPGIAGAALAEGSFGADFIAALRERPRSISPKHFYDERGSMLFERICELPEYYPTRTEMAILRQHAAAMAQWIGPQAQVLEFGAGSLAKIRVLLQALQGPQAYVPVDISAEHLARSAADLQREWPLLQVQPLVADFTQALLWPDLGGSAGVRVGFFPGSTLGNFTPAQALGFLQRAAELLRGGRLLLGVDLVKDPQLLHAAYNDAQGVTADFNLNLLQRARRELGAEFEDDGFAHSAFYNAPLQRIEMHLQSRRRQQLRVAGQVFEFAQGETLHTENSCKFTDDGLRALAQQAGWRAGPVWTDPQGWFSVHGLHAPPA